MPNNFEITGETATALYANFSNDRRNAITECPMSDKSNNAIVEDAFGFELKYADAPARQRAMLIALEDLHLDHLWVVYPGDQSCDLDHRTTVIPVADLTRLTTFIG